MNKDIIQAEALSAWMRTKIGTVLLPTGTGKTRVGRLAYDALNSPNTIVVSSLLPILDGWKKEFEHRPAKFMVINSASKYKGECDLLIVDEVHKALSDSRYNVFSCIKYKYLLCLTATLPEKKVEYMSRLEKVAPVVYSLKMSDVSTMDKVVADYQMFNVEVDMDKSTRFKYRKWDGMFKEASIALAQLKRYEPELMDYKSLFDIAKAYQARSGPEEIVRAAKAFWWAMSMRKKSLYDNDSKIEVIVNLIQKFPDKKWIIFSKSTTFADKVASRLGVRAYHSKNKERLQILEDFKNDKTKYLPVVDGVNEGVDIPEVDGAIAESSVSSTIISQQQLGRIVRFKEGKKALFFNLYVPGTPEERWVTEKTAELGAIKIKASDI